MHTLERLEALIAEAKPSTFELEDYEIRGQLTHVVFNVTDLGGRPSHFDQSAGPELEVVSVYGEDNKPMHLTKKEEKDLIDWATQHYIDQKARRS